MNKINIVLTFFSFFLISSCGSFKPKYLNEKSESIPVIEGNLEKRFYLIGDAGAAETTDTNEALVIFEKFIEDKETSKDQLIYLGDNIYPRGLPKKDEKSRKEAEVRMDAQLRSAKKFKGTTVFIPGNHDWYAKDGLKGLKRQEEYVEEGLDDNEAFQPENGCPIEEIDISENIVLLILDTQWFISDWDKHPTINDECDIKSRSDFFLEIEGELKKNNEKTILIAMHHPAFTYGLHGGYFNFKKHLNPSSGKIPLPILGTLVTQVRSQGGVSPQDRYNVRYNELMKRLITLATDSDRVIFASGHEHALQYIENEGIKQIVSGSGAKEAPVNLGEGAHFVYGGRGFATLDVYDNGGSVVTFYAPDENNDPKLMFSKVVHEPRKEYDTSLLATDFSPTRKASVYPEEKTDVSKGYEWFWGKHYRDLYGKKINFKVATLDTLLGGLTVERKGGGHQTRSLRLNTKDGKNYNLRALSKSAVQFLQTTAFVDNYIENDFRETLTEDIILDFYTASHPFGALAIPDLANAIGVYHTNPKIYYVPKHEALGKYNEEYGDELYMLVERPDEGFTDVASFGNPTTIESTSDVLENIRKDEKYRVDESAFIRARLFDMLIGDWDRHQDQWRWSRFDISDDEKIYKPIPRDRDQVFANYDGALLDILKVLMPVTKQFQKFGPKQKDVEFLNLAGIRLDRTLLQTATKEDWIAEAKYIKENLSDEVIELAFTKLPEEAQQGFSEEIIKNLKLRRDAILDFTEKYYDYISKLVVITGTDKDDKIELTRGNNGTTTISVSRIKDGEPQKPFKVRTIKKSETKEIWVYGLDDDDEFFINGKGNNPVFTRIIGGQNNDRYTVENGRAVKIYDHKSKPNTIVKRGSASYKFSDIYDQNTYDYTKKNSTINTIFPSIGFNPDDGIKIGLQDIYTVNGFKDNPFQTRHIVAASYFFATQGFELNYQGELARIFGNWNLFFKGRYTSENFAQNFFGFGNNSINMDDDLGLDFNRVKMGRLHGKIGVAKTGSYGSRVEITTGIERIEVDNSEGRFINQIFAEDAPFFEGQMFGNLDINYEYSGFDNKVNPTRGMFFKLRTGITTNTDDTDRTFGYINPSIQFFNSISRNRKLVLSTKIQGQVNVGDDFEFFQAATLGANTGLRGYRTQRFSGESALAFRGDLRYDLFKFKTGLLPLRLGVYGGYDYGRVWVDADNSRSSSNRWNDSVGGGILLNAVEAVGGEFGLFSSDDGLRFSFLLRVSL